MSTVLWMGLARCLSHRSSQAAERRCMAGAVLDCSMAQQRGWQMQGTVSSCGLNYRTGTKMRCEKHSSRGGLLAAALGGAMLLWSGDTHAFTIVVDASTRAFTYSSEGTTSFSTYNSNTSVPAGQTSQHVSAMASAASMTPFGPGAANGAASASADLVSGALRAVVSTEGTSVIQSLSTIILRFGRAFVA